MIGGIGATVIGIIIAVEIKETIGKEIAMRITGETQEETVDGSTSFWLFSQRNNKPWHRGGRHDN